MARLPLLVSRFKMMSTFTFILVFLLVINLYFNLHYSWYGISLVVRAYIYMYCFYLIFNFTSINIDLYEKSYKDKFFLKGEQLLFIEARILPIIIIYFIIIIFNLTEDAGQSNWPWNSILSILDGKNSELMVYALFLLFVIKLKKDPFFTIPIFLGLCIFYFYLNMAIYSTFKSAISIHLMMILKFVIFFFFLFYEFFRRRNPLKLLTTAVIVSIISHSLFISAFMLIFKVSPKFSYRKKESGIQLLKVGFKYPVYKLRDIFIKNPDPAFFKLLLHYAREYNAAIEYSKKEWEDLFVSGSIEMADILSGYLLDKNIPLSCGTIMLYAQKASVEPESRLSNASNFIKLASRCLPGDETDFKKRLKDSNKRFVQWALAVMGEQKNISNIPMLLEYLTDIDEDLSMTAYFSLVKITGLNPKEKLNKKINDIDVIIVFKDHFLQHRKTD